MTSTPHQLPAEDDDLLVGPVYLAGPGNPALVTGHLRAAPGWAESQTPYGRVFSSPCLRAQIAELPSSRYGGWKISWSREPLAVPAWIATFTRNTPAEIVSAFTTTLMRGVDDDHKDFLPGGPHYTPIAPGDVLIARGWKDEANALYQYQYSPDRHAYLSLRKYDTDFHDELEGCVSAERSMYACVNAANGPRWYADFTSDTPLHLITAAADALSSPAPVARNRRELPERNLPYLTSRPAASSRVTAARARTTARLLVAGSSAAPAAAAATHPGVANPRRSRR
ncbi:DUF317 domain-containing protein [Streptomyces phaeolivaceus]|uniref:DUF317 domain-containing protein n=1 Tax=Streptomyces phaeolivaceus TaxID=2653200 RepID=A0A5P8K9N1_9ACTN|nr:DUF317 domain-containing protein [Streptomyces phaeolivaceus]QFQ99327.1 DUF317 domain-containing protein [Streptomyces phaeolivaceus]